jgi:putative DNA primase/helicase
MDSLNPLAKDRPEPIAVPVLPVLVDAPPPLTRHPTLGEPSCCWTYRDPAGAVLHHVLRFDTGTGKQIRPLSPWRDEDGRPFWDWRALPEPRPLYGLDRLSSHPAAPVLLVEGEKAADAAAQLCPDMVVVTSSGGANAARRTDWSPLKGRTVWVWPDNEMPAGPIRRPSRRS